MAEEFEELDSDESVTAELVLGLAITSATEGSSISGPKSGSVSCVESVS